MQYWIKAKANESSTLAQRRHNGLNAGDIGYVKKNLGHYIKTQRYDLQFSSFQKPYSQMFLSTGFPDAAAMVAQH